MPKFHPSFAILWSFVLTSSLVAQTTIDLTGSLSPNVTTYDTSASNHIFTIASGSATQSGEISGTGTVTKTGAGTIAFTGTNSYSGGTTVSGGTLYVASDASLGVGSGALAVNSGATLSTGAYFFSNRNITFDGVGTHFTNGNGELAIGYNGTGYLALTNGATAETYNLTFGYTGGGGTVDISSGATLTANANIYISGPSFLNVNSGGTTVAAGIANSGTINLNTGGTFATSGLSGNGAFNLAGGTLRANTGFTSSSNITLSNSSTVNSNGYSPTLSGILSGTGALTKSGSGTLTLSGANTYAGATTVSGGTLSIAADSGLGTAPGSPTAGHLTLDGGALATTATFTLDANRGIALGSSGGTLDTAASTALTYGGIIAGSGTLTKSGDGTLALSGANTYTGATTVSGGTVVLSNTTTSPSFAIDSGATLELNVASGTRDGGTTTFTGTGTLAKTGAGTAVWGVGAATFELGSGAGIDVQGGVLSGGSSANEVWTNNLSDLNVASGATFTGVESNVRVDAVTGAGTITTGYNGAGYTALTIGVDDGSGTFSGVIANTDGTHIGNLVKVGSGTQTLTGANTYTGTTTVNAGTLSLGHASNTLADAGTVSIAGGTLDLGTNSDTVGTVNLASGAITGSGPLTASTFNLTHSGTISGNLAGAAALTKSGAGTVTVDGTINLSGTNGTAGAAGTDAIPTYDPEEEGVALDAGTATHGGSGGAGSAAGTVVVNAGTLTFDTSNLGLAGGSGGSGGNGGGEGPETGTAGNGGQGGSGGAGGAFTLNAGTVTLGSTSGLNLAGGHGGNGGEAGGPGESDGNGGNGGHGGSLSLAGGDLTLASGTISLSGGNGGAAGNNAGGASPGSGGSAGDFTLTSGSFTMNGGALNLTGGTTPDESFGSAGDGGDVTISGGTFNWNGGTIDLRSGSADELATDGTFNLSGGTLVSTASQMDGANNFHGDFAFNSGTLRLTDTTVTFSDGDGVFQDAFAEEGMPAELGNRQLVIDHTFEIAADFAVTSSGTLTADAIHVAGGTFKVSANNAVSTGTSLSLADTASALVELEANQTFASLSGGGSSGGNISFLSSATLTIGDATSTTYAGSISGDDASLTKIGGGTLTLSGDNSYSGTTHVSAGTLAAGSNTALGSSAASISAGATLDLDGHSITVAGLEGAGSVTLGSSTLTVDSSDADTTFSGTLAGTDGALTKSGTYTLTLTGANSYTGTTTISDGTLQIGNDGDTGSIASATVTNNGTLTFNRSNAMAFAGDIGGSGVVNQSGSGPLTLSGDNSYTGETNVTDGTLVLASDTALGTTASGTTVESSGTLAFTNNISVGAEAIANDGTVDNLSGTNSYAGALSGSGNLTVTAGQLTLSGDNSSFTGSTAINGGTLALGSANALGSSASVDVADGASLNLNNHSVSIADLDTAGTGAIALGSATLTTGDANDHAVTGIISGTGSLTKQGTGNLTLSGANTYEGGTTITSGTLTGTTSSLQGNITNDAAVAFDQSSTGTYADVLSGSGTFTKSGTGNVTLSGTHTFSGATTVADGTLTLANDSALGTTASGTTVNSGATLAFTNNISVGTEAIANEGTVDNVSGTNSYAGALSGSGDLSVTAGQLTLSGANVHTGATTVASGSTLNLQAADTLSSSSALTLGTTGALVLNDNNQTVGYLGGDGTIDLGSAKLTIGAHDATSTYIGNISGIGGSLEKIGSGTLSLADTNSYTGGTTITAGNLIGNTYSLQGDIENNATLTVSQNVSGTIASDISGTGALVSSGSGIITLSGTNSYTGGTTVSFGTQLRGSTSSLQGDISNGWVVYFQQSTDGTYSGILSGTGILGTLGTGAVTLAGDNTYTGATEIAYGTLRLGSANALGSTSSIYVYSDGTFDLNGYDATTPSFGGSGSTLLDSGTLTVGNADNHEYSGVISESGNLIKIGSGTLTLSGVNTYTGSTTINAGTLAIAADSGLGAAPISPNSSQLILNGGTLLATTTVTLDANRGIYLDSSGGTLESTYPTTLTVNGEITGSGNLGIDGEGNVTLARDNAFSGTTTLLDGDATLTLGHVDALQNSTLTTTGGLRFGSLESANLAAISGSQDLVLQNASNAAVALILGQNHSSTTTHSGVISGSGSLTIADGDLTLSGANTFTGATTLANGNLTLANESGLQNSTVTLSGGNLSYGSGVDAVTFGGLAGSYELTLPSTSLTVGGNHANTSYSGTVSDSGTFIKAGDGNLTFSGSFNDSAPVRLDAGTFTLANASALERNIVTLNGGALSFGTLTSASLNGLSGSTNLALTNADSTPANVALTIGYDGGDSTYAGVLSGGGSLIKEGYGTFTLSGANTFTGNTTLSDGTLALASSGSLAGDVNLNSGTLSLANATGLQHSTVNLNGGDLSYGSGIHAVTFGGLAGSGDLTLPATSLTVGINHANTSYSGTVSHSGTFIKAGDGNLTFGGSFNDSAPVRLDAGTFTLANASALERSTVTLNGGALSFGTLTSASFDGLNGSTNLALTNADSTPANVALTIGYDGGDSTYDGVLSGGGSLIKEGYGTFTLSGANTFTGNTTLSDGTLALASSGSLAGDVNLNSGTLSLANATGLQHSTVNLNGGDLSYGSGIHAVTFGGLAGSGDLTLPATSLTVGINHANTSYSGTVSHSGTFIKAGDGNLTFGGSFNDSAPVRLDAGTFTLANASALERSTVTLNGGALSFGTLTSASFDGLNGSTNLALTNADSTPANVALTIGYDGGDSTYAGVLSGGGSLIKEGYGTFTLSGANTFTGPTTLNSGTLTLGHEDALATSIVTTSGGTLSFGALENVNLRALNTSSEIVISSSSANPFTLTIGGSGNDNSTWSDYLGGSGSINKVGAGTLTLSGYSSGYSGTTTLSGGTVKLEGSSVLEYSTLHTVNGGGTLDFASNTTVELGGLEGDGDLTLANETLAAVTIEVGKNNANTILSGSLSGAGGLFKRGDGTLTLSGANTFSGDTTVSAGTLAIAHPLALQNSVVIPGTGLSFGELESATFGGLKDSGTVILTNSATTPAGVTLTLDVAADMPTGPSYYGTLSGEGSLIKTGTGTQTITGTVSHAGGTTVSAGTLILSGPNTASGDTTVSGGTLKLEAGNALQNSTLVTAAAGGTVSFSNQTAFTLGGLAGDGDLALTNGATPITLTVGNNNASTNYSGVLSQGVSALESANLIKSGSGTLTLSGANTFSGTTTISAGTLELAHSHALQNSIVTPGTGLSFGELENVTLGGLSGSGALALTNTAANPADVALTLNVASGFPPGPTYSGVLSGDGSLTKTGTGTQILSGANTFTGDTIVSAGTLKLENSNALQNSTLVTSASGGTVDFSSLSSLNLGGLAGDGAINASPSSLDLNVGSNNQDTAYSGALSGSVNLTKRGTGTLSLSGTNGYSNSDMPPFGTTTTISAGTLEYATRAAFYHGSTRANPNVADGATAAFHVGGSGYFTDSDIGDIMGDDNFSSGATLELNTADAPDGTFTLATALANGNSGANTLNVTKSGAGTLTLTGANTYTGATTIEAGTLQLGANDRLSSSTAVTVAAGATFDLNNFSNTVGGLQGAGNVNLGSGSLTSIYASDQELSGNITGSGSFFVGGSGTLTLSGNNEGLRFLNLYSEGVKLGSDTALPSGTLVSFLGSGTTLDLNDHAASMAIHDSGEDTTINLGSSSGSLTVEDTIGDLGATIVGTGSLIKAGSSSLTLTGTNTYTGTTAIQEGTIYAANATALGTSTADISSGATLNLNTHLTIGGLAGAGTVTLDGFNLAIDSTGDDHFSGNFQTGFSSEPSITKTGSGSLTLSSSNFFGETMINVNGGTLIAAHSQALPHNAVNVASGATLALSNDISIGNSVVNDGTLKNLSGTNTYSGAASGSGEVVATAGTLSLTGNNSYSGATTVQSGATLNVGSATALGSTAGGTTVDSGGTLAFTGGAAVGAEAIANAGTITNASGTNSYAGSLSGGGALTVTAGQLTLSGDNSGFSGTVGLNDGTLQIATANNLGTGALEFGTGTLATTGSIELGHNLTIGSANEAGFAPATGTTLTLSGIVAGTGSLAKSDTGTLFLSGPNTYEGATTVSVGTLRLGSAAALGNTTSVDVSSGATLDLNDHSVTIADLDGAGAITLGSATLTTGDTNDHALSGVISGSGALIKNGAGTLTLSGDNTYTGTTAIGTGTLTLASDTALGATSTGTTVAFGTTLAFSNDISVGAEAIANSGTVTNLSGANSYAGVLSGTGNLTVADGTLTLSGDNTYQGTTTVSAGTLRLGSAHALGNTGAVDVASGATLDLNHQAATISDLDGAGAITLGSATLTTGDAATHTLSGVISGTGSLVTTGSGTLNLRGTNTYTGNTTIGDSTTLALNQGGNVTQSGHLLVNNGTLDVSDGGTFATLGTATLNSESTPFGPSLTVRNGATFAVTGDSTLNQSAAINLSGGATFDSAANVTVNDDASLTATSGGSFDIDGQLSLADNAGFTGGSSSTSTVGSLVASGTNVLQLIGGGSLTSAGDATFGGTSSLSTSDGGAFTARSNLILANGAADNVALTFTQGSSSVTGDVHLGQAGTASLTVSEAGFNVGGAIILSDAENSSGTLTVTQSSLGIGGTDAIRRGDGTAQVTFDSVNLNVTGSDLTTSVDLTIHNTVNVNANVLNSTLSGTINGDGALTKSGSGTLTLSGTNSFTGTTAVNEGTLSIAADSGLGAAPGSATAGHLTLDGGTLATTASFELAANRGIALGSSGGTVETADATTLSYGGIIDGSGTLTKTGAGTLALSGTNTYTGGTTVDSGILTANAAAQFGTGAINITSGGAVEMSSTTTFLQDVTITGSGSRLTGYDNIAELVGEDFALDRNNYTAFGANEASRTVTISDGGSLTGTLIAFDANTDQDMTINLANGGQITADMALVVGASGGGNTSLNVDGTGSLISAANGGLIIGFANETATANVTVANGGAIVAGGIRVGMPFTGDAQGNLTINDGGTVTADQVWLDSKPTGFDTLQLNSGGTLEITGGTNALDSTLDNGVAFNGGTLQLTTNSFSSSTGFTLGAGTTSTVETRGVDATLSGTLSGTGNLTKTGNNTLTLSGTNTYEGTTAVDAGTLTLASDAALGSTTTGTTVASGATLAFTNNINVGTEAISSSGTVTNTSGDNTFAGVLSGTGSLAVTSGSLTLSGGSYASDGDSLVITGDNTYTGATTIASGATLAFAGPFNPTSTEDPYNVLFGLFENGAPERSLTTSGIINQGTLALNGVGYLANGSAITGGGDLTVSGVSAAVLQAHGNQLGDVTVGSAAAMLMAGNSTLTSLEVNNGLFAAEGGTSSINGSVDLGNDGTTGRGILEIYGAGTSLDITGDIVNHGTARVRINEGQLSVTGNVNFAGATNQADFEVSNGGSATIGGNLVLNGTLTSQGENVSPLGTMTASVRENASLRVDGAIQLGLDAGTSGNLNIEGTLQVGGSDGILTGAGETQVSLGNGTLQVIGSDFTTAADMELVYNPSSGTGTVDTNGFNATLSGTLDGNGSLTKTGSGTLTLSGANTYEGGTTISAGTLNLANSSGSATGTGDVMIADGASLTGSGSIAGSLNLAAGATFAPGNSPGLVTIGGDFTLDSASIINLEIAGLSRGTNYDAFDVGGTLTLDGTLNISLINGFTPGTSASFSLFTAHSIGGTFATINLPTIAGATWNTSAFASSGLLTLTASAVPEPSAAAALVGLAMLGLAATRRRRRV